MPNTPYKDLQNKYRTNKSPRHKQTAINLLVNHQKHMDQTQKLNSYLCQAIYRNSDIKTISDVIANPTILYRSENTNTTEAKINR